MNLLSRGVWEREGHCKKEKAKGQQEKNSVSEITSNEMEGKKKKCLEMLSPFSYEFLPVESSIVYLLIK